MTSLPASVRRVRLQSMRSVRPEHDGRMTLVEHLRELRSRVLKSALTVVIATIVCLFVAYEPIRRTITQPYCDVPAKHRAVTNLANTCALIIHGPLDGFTFRLKIALIAAIVVSAPVWLWQLWRFVTPGLKRNERKYGLAFIFASTILFAIGTVLAYLVLGKSLDALLSFGGQGVVAQLTADEYLGFVIAMITAFGLGFEFPLIVVMLNFAGIVPTSALRKWRRVAFFLLICFAGFAVPSSDPFSMLFLAVPLCVLYEATVVIGRVHDRRVRHRDETAGYALLGDDEASPLPVASATPAGPSDLELTDYT